MAKEGWNEEAAEYFTSQAYEATKRALMQERRIRALERRIALLERIVAKASDNEAARQAVTMQEGE